MLLDFKTSYKLTVIKAVWYWQNDNKEIEPGNWEFIPNPAMLCLGVGWAMVSTVRNFLSGFRPALSGFSLTWNALNLLIGFCSSQKDSLGHGLF